MSTHRGGGGRKGRRRPTLEELGKAPYIEVIPPIDEDDEVISFEGYTHQVGEEIGVESGGGVVLEWRTCLRIDAKATRTLRGRRVSRRGSSSGTSSEGSKISVLLSVNWSHKFEVTKRTLSS